MSEFGVEVFDTRDRRVGDSDCLDWEILRIGDGAWCMRVDSGSMVMRQITPPYCFQDPVSARVAFKERMYAK